MTFNASKEWVTMEDNEMYSPHNLLIVAFWMLNFSTLATTH